MTARKILLAMTAVVVVAGAIAYSQGIRSPEQAMASVRSIHSFGDVVARVEGLWAPKPVAAQAPRRAAARVVPVEVTTAIEQKTPVQIAVLGTVTPMASVIIKPRVDSVVTEVHFADGAAVKAGDVLFTLDSRSIEAQIRQAEGLVARDQAQVEGAERDVRRYTDLVAKNATPVTNLDNAKTQSATFRAQMKADQASLDNLRVLLSYCTIRAPISGRISAANVKVGNFVRAGSDTVQLATIIQTAPIYVSFAVPQKDLPDVRSALAAKTASVDVGIPGEPKRASGKVAMIENTVDPTTGMVMVRADMPNTDALLWPGTLVSTTLKLRDEDAIVVPSVAVQVGQSGNFVFVIKDGEAKVRPVTVERTYNSVSVITKGLQMGEVVVTDGQLLLGDGTKVTIREKKAGA
jgi:RND family efflux transporter MFP subunit